MLIKPVCLWRNKGVHSVMLKTAGEAGKAGEAGDVKTGWVRLSTSAPLRLITAGEVFSMTWASVVTGRRHSTRADFSTEKKHIKTSLSLQ